MRHQRGFAQNEIEGNTGGEPKQRVVFPLKMNSLRRLDILTLNFPCFLTRSAFSQPLPRYHRLWYGGIRTPDWILTVANLCAVRRQQPNYARSS